MPKMLLPAVLGFLLRRLGAPAHQAGALVVVQAAAQWVKTHRVVWHGIR
jgi:hypothetical protein